jgi:surface antigen
MHKLTKIGLSAVLSTMLLSASMVWAQTSIFAPTVIGLQNGDFDLMMAAEAKFYVADAPELGTTASWENPKNGDHGTAKLIEVYEWQDLPCRRIQHIVHIVSEKDLQTVTLDRCQVASGEWKFRF